MATARMTALRSKTGGVEAAVKPGGTVGWTRLRSRERQSRCVGV
ncbi:MAG: hypothetical protein QXO32_06780 [Candidatus Bathyarchaeia archaeon]